MMRTGRKLRILYVWTAAEFSVFDVARGYRRALDASDDLDVHDFRLHARCRYHAQALGERRAANPELLSKQASETVIIEAMRQQSDLVLIISGLTFHPNGLELLRRSAWYDDARQDWNRFRVVTIFTESPYEDQDQLRFQSQDPSMVCFTNEKISTRYGWTYLGSCFDPSIHQPVAPTVSQDVLICGTGWPDRQAMLEGVDWTGINLKLYGLWPTVTPHSPLAPYLDSICLRNDALPGYYAGTKIALNFHRCHPHAYSANPRAFELAACGAFQLSDPRPEVRDLFGEAVPTFRSAEELESLIRYYLDRPDDRHDRARQARQIVQSCSFAHRAATMFQTLGWSVDRPQMSRVMPVA